jgi:hypothetical protein
MDKETVSKETPYDTLLSVCQLSYRKHVMEDNSVGWDSLSSQLGEALLSVMGEEAFNKWVEEVESDDNTP